MKARVMLLPAVMLIALGAMIFAPSLVDKAFETEPSREVFSVDAKVQKAHWANFSWAERLEGIYQKNPSLVPVKDQEPRPQAFEDLLKFTAKQGGRAFRARDSKLLLPTVYSELLAKLRALPEMPPSAELDTGIRSTPSVLQNCFFESLEKHLLESENLGKDDEATELTQLAMRVLRHKAAYPSCLISIPRGRESRFLKHPEAYRLSPEVMRHVIRFDFQNRFARLLSRLPGVAERSSEHVAYHAHTGSYETYAFDREPKLVEVPTMAAFEQAETSLVNEFLKELEALR